jgi:glycosyltransferase involved in cell wall biosynthesis
MTVAPPARAVAPVTVLHLVANRWWTGSADPVLRLLEALRRRGHRPLLGVIPGDRFETKAREIGFVPLPGLSLAPRITPWSVVRDVTRLRGLVRREGVEVIHTHHSHDHWLATLARAQTGSRGRVPVVRTFHNLRAVRSGRLERWLYGRTAAVFAVSRRIEARCREVGVAAARVVWTPGIADLPRFVPGADPAPIRAEFALGEAPVVVSVARLAANRGHELLVDAFRLLLATHPAARLLLVGKGETRARLERTVAEAGLAGRVSFTGYRDHDLPAVLAAADCFALMAAGSDDTCRAVLEAMAAARPVVARRVGALPETIAHGVTGLLVDEDRPEAVAAALSAVLGDRERARAMGRAGRERAMTEFSAERAVAIAEDVYRRLT